MPRVRNSTFKRLRQFYKGGLLQKFILKYILFRPQCDFIWDFWDYGQVDLRTGKTAEGSMSSEMATVQRVGNRLISAARFVYVLVQCYRLLFSPTNIILLCKSTCLTMSTIITIFITEHRLHVKDVLMASSSLAMGEVVKLKDRDVTVVRLYTGVAGSRDALYVIADQPSTLDTFWWSLQKMAIQLTTKKVVQDVPITRRDTSEMTATEAAILPKLSPGQCVVPRHELQSAHDDMLATSLRVLERRWNFFMFVNTALMRHNFVISLTRQSWLIKFQKCVLLEQYIPVS